MDACLEELALVLEEVERVSLTAKLHVNVNDNYFNDNANVNDN